MEYSTIFFLLIFVSSGNSQCSTPDGRFPTGDQCDAYVECRGGIASSQTCPDGLVFNDQVDRLDRYPCQYPVEVNCGSRGRLQQANPTEHCPHQYGLYSHEDQRNCGQFWNCVGGRAFLFDCPEGLAFNKETLRCEWPDETDCNAEDFLGFRCPPADAELLDLFLGKPRYPHPTECNKFYVCINGVKPRLLQCESGFVFNHQLHACDRPENVPNCSG